MKLVKSSFKDKRDYDNIMKAIQYNMWLICGNNPKKQKKYYTLFREKCIGANVINPENRKSKTLGWCEATVKEDFRVSFVGHKKKGNNEIQLLHTSIHEVLHGTQFLGVHLNKNKSLEYKCAKNLCRSYGGMIMEYDKSILNRGQKDLYGILICETLTELLSYVCLSYLDENYKHHQVTADDILLDSKNPFVYDEDFYKSEYAKHLPIAKLLIAAYHNDSALTFNKYCDEGKSIVNTKKDGKPLNTLIYGVMNDPMLIEHEYNKYMGYDNYYRLNKKLDVLFKKYDKNVSNVQEILDDILIFAYNRHMIMYREKELTKDAAIKLFSNVYYTYLAVSKHYRKINECRNDYYKKK